MLLAGGQLDIKGEDGSIQSIGIADVSVRTDSIPVYNLEVEFSHTFFVGEDGALAHNGIVYKRTRPGSSKPYYGKADNEKNYRERMRRHRKKCGADTTFEEVYEGPEVGRDLERIEQEFIDRAGGPTTRTRDGRVSREGGTENARNNFRKKR
ncbi:hypothetical protein [Pseudoxanthomonas suwonensis]